MSCCVVWHQQEDREMHDLYARKLLQPGWGGLLTLAEAEYVRDCLERDSRLRQRWGIRRKKVPLSLIAEKTFPENPGAARRHMAAEQARARRKSRSRAKTSPPANGVGANSPGHMIKSIARGVRQEGPLRPGRQRPGRARPQKTVKRGEL